MRLRPTPPAFRLRTKIGDCGSGKRAASLLAEAAAKNPFVQRQIELANPDILVTVGQPSTGALIGVQGIMKNRGRWFTYQTGTREIRAMPMLHPAYLLRTPLAKRMAWRDMLAIKKALG